MKRAILGVILAAACSNSSPAAPDGSIDALSPPDIPRTQTEAQLAPMRQACTFQAGAWAASTIGNEYPLGDDIPIKHVIVIMQENRSFDHYLGRLVAQGYYTAAELDGPPAGWSNPDGQGGTVVPHADNEYCYGVNHGWGDMHEDWDNGANDGFVQNNMPDGQKSFFYEDDTVIPFYYALANDFSVGNRYFASVLTSTWPNRMFLMGATSYGIGDNSFVKVDTPDTPVPLIFTELEAAGRVWKDYADLAHQAQFYPHFGTEVTTNRQLKDVKCDLMTNLTNGTLPDVAFVMGSEISGETTDEGPSALPAIGGALVEEIVRALLASPAWKDTVLFITYDENGGLADHVPPAPACPPDSYAPHDQFGTSLPGAFDHTGFRVPFIVVSPYAKAHFVSHTVYDHTSITRFIEAKFGLPALTARDANAAAPMEMFDWAHPPFMTPPNIAAHTTVDPSILTQCHQTMAPWGCTP